MHILDLEDAQQGLNELEKLLIKDKVAPLIKNSA